METKDDPEPTSLSEDAARAGVTGHHVRAVLAFGLAGVIVAFIAIAVYYGFDRLAQAFLRFASDPLSSFQNNVAYAFVIVIAAVGAVLLLGLWNSVAGQSADTSQWGMRIRVVLQFAIICAAMAILYLSAR